MGDPYRPTPQGRPRWRVWWDHFEDYALAFGIADEPEECAWLDPPEFERCARYADRHAGART